MSNSLIRITKDNAQSLLGNLRPLSRLLAEEALDLKYRVDVYEDLNIFRVSCGRQSHFIRGAITSLNNYVGADIADHKFYTNSILRDAGIPVPRSVRIQKKSFAKGDWSVSGLRAPLVVKPTYGTLKGLGVVTNISGQRDLMRYLKKGFQTYSSILVEEFHQDLNDYRVLVLDNKVIGVLHRIPAYVVGDGVSNIGALIREKNEKRKQVHEIKLGPISIDAELKNKLKSQRLNMRSIPSADRRVMLKNVCNFGAGGEVHDVTDKISKANVELALRICKVMNLRLAGLDFLCTDISKSVRHTDGVVLELNQHPDFAMHHFPQEGKARNVSRQIVRAMFK
ncbi:MAG: hypothetical protein COW24_04000 [Candidatus Kerfeldbacteria bacterium CG15_BIG_FIL_POST_REV_8_21_14_020_45_12]|uniref:ATP-grasp domain-containing protein n=1 Tax=Candidatus Kerfeldbacteria bacterium CG15_BIG_FIL_POST_REV_8_21_14_020_45_12 TaxID=2014247 RepID=A0A2M7H390_9BACT|nr:MAG: hypothetical protein COW24_04000 [Candidatus Kerfeldbacteria bacterium CG15_BIG_FIL_POST_REV_8_21_14_020_45_12]PJA93849.1 MAG: hypothetical protein CO132_01145 [Candidatus Kerfeldbacteria bacterium CG_4_9_14_3_um_filter_45_8]